MGATKLMRSAYNWVHHKHFILTYYFTHTHAACCACRMRDLQSKPASYELSSDEIRQLQFDLESMYGAFTALLKASK